MESNDSPEIPDRGEISDIPGLPSGDPSIAAICIKVNKEHKQNKLNGEHKQNKQVNSLKLR